MTEVHLLRNADDGDGRRVEKMADLGERPVLDVDMGAGKAAQPVERHELSGPDDEGIDLGLLDDVAVGRLEGRIMGRQVEKYGVGVAQLRRAKDGRFRPRNGLTSLS